MELLILQQAFLRHVRRFADWRDALGVVADFLRVRRFADFQQELGIAPEVLRDRLGRFVELGVLVQQRGSAERNEYRIAAKGLACFPVFAFLVGRAEEWSVPSPWSELTIAHQACWSPLRPFPGCTSCRKPLARTEIRFDLGPGSG